MRAVVCETFGPPEDLVVEELDDPQPGRGQLLVDVAAAAVTFPDTLMLEDKYQFKATPPYVPGGRSPASSTAIGDGVDGLVVGDRVVGGLGTTGGFAELAVVPAAAARRLPDTVDFDVVAGLNYAYGTSLYGLKHRAAPAAGRDAARARRRRRRRAVGGRARPAARARGSSPPRRARRSSTCAASAAPTRRSTTRREDLKDRAKELTGGQGVDVVYDCVGGARGRAGAAGDRLGGPLPRDRVHRRHPVDPAQPDAAQELPDRRRVLRRDDGARPGAQPGRSATS